MRRRITLRGVPVNQIMQARERERDRLQERFKNDPATLTKFIDYILNSGWTGKFIESAVEQYTNHERPPIPVFLQGNGHVLDQIWLNQGAYTHFEDTAAYPNFALRFRGEMETMLRRLTPGDLMMLDAAHRVHARFPSIDDEADCYWELLWKAVYHGIYREPLTNGLVKPHEHAYGDPWQAVCAAVAAYVGVTRNDDNGDWRGLTRTFFEPTSRFYVGVDVRQEHMRQPNSDRFEVTHRFHRVDSEESLWMAACVVLCYAVDEVGRDYTTYETTLSPWFDFTDKVQSIWTRQLPIHYAKCTIGNGSNADQLQVNAAEPRGDGSL